VIWTGTCGFGRRQADVLAQLDAVEIQETFYRPVSAERASKWRAMAPQGFRFCVKASQFITHEATSPTYRKSNRVVPDSEKLAYGSFRDTPQVREGWEATRSFAEAIRADAIVFQTPASFGPTETNRTALYRFFESIRTHATSPPPTDSPTFVSTEPPRGRRCISIPTQTRTWHGSWRSVGNTMTHM